MGSICQKVEASGRVPKFGQNRWRGTSNSQGSPLLFMQAQTRPVLKMPGFFQPRGTASCSTALPRQETLPQKGADQYPDGKVRR